MFPNNARSGASLGLALALGVLLCALAPSARAEEADRTSLQPELVVEQQWNSNIFGADHYKEHSPVTIVRPGLTFLNQGELGSVRFNGFLSNHLYWDESGLNGADRGASLRFDRKLAPGFEVFGDGSMIRYTDRDEIRSDVPGSGQEGVLVSAGAPDIDIDQASGGLRYLLDARTRMELSGGPFNIAYNRHPVGATTYRDRVGWYSSWTLTHQWTALDQLSFQLGASVTDQDSAPIDVFDQRTGVTLEDTTPVELESGESYSQQQTATVGWERSWSPLWLTSISIGARRLDSHVSGASRKAAVPIVTVIEPEENVFVFGVAPTETYIPIDYDDLGPALIGTLLIQRTFARSSLSFSYSRETQVASGALSSDVDVDAFELSFRHRLAERITLQLNGTFDYYVSANDAPQLAPAYFTPVPLDDWDPASTADYTCGGLLGPGGKLIVTGKYGQCEIGTSSELNGQRMTLGGRVEWQMRKRLASFLTVRYYDQRGDPGLWGGDYNKYTIGVGFRYAWDLEL